MYNHLCHEQLNLLSSLQLSVSVFCSYSSVLCVLSVELLSVCVYARAVHYFVLSGRRRGLFSLSLFPSPFFFPSLSSLSLLCNIIVSVFSFICMERAPAAHLFMFRGKKQKSVGI